MQKRKLVIGDYDTASHGWTLTAWKLGAAEQKTQYVEKILGDGSWDLSTAATDGIPKYKDRPFSATLELSEGTRAEREAIIRSMINQLDGFRHEILLPDDDTHYIVGRVHVVREYNDLAHAGISITSTVEPWKYAITENTVTVTAAADSKTVKLTNKGRRFIVPEIEVSGSNASVTLVKGSSSKSFSAGKWLWSSLLLTTGDHTLTYLGTGTIKITWREAVLE